MNGAGWTLTILGVIAASAALIAAGLAVGRLGILGGIFGAHLARCFKQIGREFVHFIGAMAVALLLLPIALARMVLLKPAAAREALQSSGRELRNAFIALYALLVVQPLRLLGLRAVLSYIESRLPAAMTGTDATLDHQNGSPRSARAEFVGYTVLRELQRGGSGARLYVCEPDARTRIKIGIADGGDAIYDSNLLIMADSVQTVTLAVDDTLNVVANSSRTFDILANDTQTGSAPLTITQINGTTVSVGQTVTLT